MEIFAAAVLGVVQGITEFLPISSSAHLILVPWFLGWRAEGLFFDVALHFGTAIALLAYFRSEWVLLSREFFRGLFQRDPFGSPERRMAWYLVLGTIPAALAGLAFEQLVTEYLRSPLVTVGTLVTFGVLLFCADRFSTHTRSLEQFTWRDSLWIGSSQVLALIPGVSRSGITITTALMRGCNRPAAARFSFMLSTPVIVGAAALEGWHFVEASRELDASAGLASAVIGLQGAVLLAGILSAALTGWLIIRFFLQYVQSRNLVPFVIYRFLLAVVVLAFYLRQ